MDRVITLAYNPTSWNRREAAPWPGGMVDAIMQPVLPHLPDGSWRVTNQPARYGPSVLFAFPDRYRIHRGDRVGDPAIFISHGVADKRWRHARKLIRCRFHWSIVSGPLWVDKLRGGGFDGAVVGGWPKLDPIFNDELPHPDRDWTKIRVLWAPTHGGGGEPRTGDSTPRRKKGSAKRSSWWHRDAIRRALPPSEFELVVAPHPRHRPDKRATLAEYVDADVVVADGGSTIYEAMALGIPVVFPTWLTGGPNERRRTIEAEIYRDRIGRHADSPRNLTHLVYQAAIHGITGPEVEFIEPIIPEHTRGKAGKMTADALLEILEHPTPWLPERMTYRNAFGREVTISTGTARERALARSPAWHAVAGPAAPQTQAARPTAATVGPGLADPDPRSEPTTDLRDTPDRGIVIPPSGRAGGR